MITDYACHHRGIGFHVDYQASLWLTNSWYVSIGFDHISSPPYGMFDSTQFDESWINVPVPQFKRTQAYRANQWLLAYAKGIEVGLAAGNLPKVARPHPRFEKGGHDEGA